MIFILYTLFYHSQYSLFASNSHSDIGLHLLSNRSIEFFFSTSLSVVLCFFTYFSCFESSKWSPCFLRSSEKDLFYFIPSPESRVNSIIGYTCFFSPFTESEGFIFVSKCALEFSEHIKVLILDK